VHNKSTGSLIGFTDLGGTLQQVNDYEERLPSGNENRPLAKTMIIFLWSTISVAILNRAETITDF